MNMSSSKGRGRGRGRGQQKNQPHPVVGADPDVNFPALGAANVEPQKCSSKGRGKTQRKLSDAEGSLQGACSATGNTSNTCVDKKEKDIPPTDTTISIPETNFQLPKLNKKLAVRPGYGSCGRPIELLSNYFSLKLSGTVYHYDIEMNSFGQMKKYGKQKCKTRQLTTTEVYKRGATNLEHELERSVSKLKRKEILEELVKSCHLEDFCPVFDGVKNLFTSKPFPFANEQVFTVELEIGDKIRKYEVIIKPVKKSDGSNKISLSGLANSSENENEILMALNCIMNHRSTSSQQLQIGRSFFYLNQTNKISLGEGLEIWFGYHQSVHSTEKGAVVLINLAAKAFHKDGPVIDYINDIIKRDIRRGESIRTYELKNIISSLKGLRVEVTHLPYPRRYVIQDVTKLSAQDMKLEIDGKHLSVAQYFERRYCKLKFPSLPCLQMRATNKTYIPIEHCKIMKGQPKLGKINPAVGAKMIKQTAITPNDRFSSITRASQEIHRETSHRMKYFNLFMDLQLMPVIGRVLEPPSLCYDARDAAIPDARGMWNINGKRFFKSVIDVDSWIIIDFANCSSQAINKFINFFLTAARKVGLNFGKRLDTLSCDRLGAYQALKDAEKTKASFAVIILSRRDRFHSYDEIKFIADYQLQFITQCIDEKILDRFNDQIATNLCLKINVKLGGVNHVLRNRLRILSSPIMIFGADAVHSARGSRCPSIAAVVGSMDSYPSKYKIACRVQENQDEDKISQEIILEMREMVESLLTKFYKHTKGKYPEKIVFYRDGVSEGQFETVYEYEVRKIQEASKEIIGYVVPVTFIVVQKRHQTRFKPKYPRDGVGRAGNIPPGTTVDRDIVHPNRFDYFLNSHEGIQGTCKSAHYTVLHDDSNFSADELQQLSYHLCYTYNKCNRSISIPAPVKYADLACYRAKKYADFHLQKEQGLSSSSESKLSDHAVNAINTMGEIGTDFFFV